MSCFSIPAFGQEAEPSPVPTTIVVEEARREGPATASVTSVDLAPFTTRAARTPDVLDRLAGVDVLSYGGSGQGSYVRLRGSTAAQVLVLVDGVRVNPVSGGGADLDSIPLELLDRVEVTRGAGASRWGADALGGVVSFRSDPAEGRAGATVTAGSFGSVRSSAFAAGTARGWRGDLALRQDEGAERWRYHDDLRGEVRTRENVGSRALGGSLGARGPVAGGELAFRAWGTTLAAGAPGLTEFPTPRARRVEERGVALLRWEREDLLVDASRRVESTRYRNPDPILGDDPIDVATRGAATSASIVLRRAPAESARITAGADVRHESLLDRDAGRRERLVAGAHGEVWRAIGRRAEATFAVRLDGLERDEGMSWAPLPSAGIAFHPGAAWTLRAHGGRAQRVPTFLELWLPNMETVGGNPDLVPEDAWTADAGVTWAPGPVAIETSAFATRLTESIFFAPVSPYRFAAVNGGPSTLMGAEAGIDARLPADVTLSASWTHLESRRDETGKPLPGRPRDRLAARASWRATSRLEAFADATWSSAAYADFFGNLQVPAGEVAGAGFTADLPSGVAVTVEATNLTDSDVRDARYFPQPGRTFWLTVSWRRFKGDRS